MFDSGCEMGVDDPVDPRLEDAFDWASIERELRRDEEERTWGNTTPSGLFALEIDTDTGDETGLSDPQLIDAIVGFERLTGWAQARQARLLAEFARRRPGDDPTLVATDKPCTIGRFAPDEVGLALKQARMSAKARLGRSLQLQQVLPETRALWEQGRLDERRVAAICDTTHYLSTENARAVQQRVLQRAPEQTVGQLKAALKRAVIAADPEGAAERHQAARRDRRVSISAEQDGMASLWALMTAPDAQASYQWLTRLALGCGKHDPRGMDARRADIAAALLSGRLTNATPDTDSDTDPDTDPDADPDADPGRDSDQGADQGADADTNADIHAHTGATHTGATHSDTDTGSTDTGSTDTGSTDTGSTDTGSTADDEDSGSGPTRDAQGSPAGAAGDPGRGRPGNGAGAGGSGADENGRAPRPVNPGKPLVQVLMPFTTLIGADDQPCELVGHGPIPAHLAREITTDAVLRRLVYDPLTGTVLDYGRTTYRPPTGLADHVRARDVYCRGPICRHRALDAHLDHIQPYPHGPTNEKNLHGCCGHEHRMKHAPGWAVRALPDGRIQWITPTGHRYHSHPHDYRPHTQQPDHEPPPEPELPPDPATPPKGLPQDLANRLEQLHRARNATALWNNGPIPEDDEDEPPPF
jgi:hypothetical protein